MDGYYLGVYNGKFILYGFKFEKAPEEDNLQGLKRSLKDGFNLPCFYYPV